MTTTVIEPGPTAAIDSPVADVARRLRWHPSMVLLPTVDLVGLATAGLLAGVPAWWATAYACA
ncbi:MAG: hypothetical protein ACRDTJ_29015, partial [Pseudonocardiaceae bacterium]